LNRGDRNGADWVPAECDVSIRPGWFYHSNQDASVKSPGQLLDLYFQSVGRGAVFLLNIPPDPRGQIHENDARSLRQFARLRNAIFADDLARRATASASNTRGAAPRFGPRNVVDGKPGTYWATDDGITNAQLVLEFREPITFNIVRLREYLPLGQRVEGFALDRWQEGQWSPFAAGASIGHCRLLRTETVSTQKVRLRIVKSPVCPAISQMSLFMDQRAAP